MLLHTSLIFKAYITIKSNIRLSKCIVVYYFFRQFININIITTKQKVGMYYDY